MEARLRLPPYAYGGGISGRLNPTTGARYAAWLYPDNSAGGGNVLRIIRFSNWTSWVPLAEIPVAIPGTDWHTLKLAFSGARISAFLDDALAATVLDPEAGVPTSGGISVEMWTDVNRYLLEVDSVVVQGLAADDYYSVQADMPLEVATPGVLVNDTDPLGGALTSDLVTPTAHGQLTLQADGSFNYLPAAGFSGTDRFIYRTRAGTNTLGTAWAVINVLGPGPSDPPSIHSIRILQGNAEMSWNSIVGRTYRLQYLDRLPGSEWSNAIPDILAVGTTAAATNAIGTNAQRFYRVLLLP